MPTKSAGISYQGDKGFPRHFTRSSLMRFSIVYYSEKMLFYYADRKVYIRYDFIGLIIWSGLGHFV